MLIGNRSELFVRLATRVAATSNKMDHNKNKRKKNENNQRRRNSNTIPNEDEINVPSTGVWSKSKKKRMRALMSKNKQQDQPKPQNPRQNQYQNDHQQQQIDTLHKREKRTSHKKMKILLNDSAENNCHRMIKQEIDIVQKQSSSDKSSTDTSNNRLTSTSSLSKLQEHYKQRLLGSRFRILNEELYTTHSKESFERFQSNPRLFQEYHDGFRHQVQEWPTNPINVIVDLIKKQAMKREQQHKQVVDQDDGNKLSSKQLIVADFGCGEAQLAKDLLSYRVTKSINDKVEAKQLNQQDRTTASKVPKNATKSYCPFIVHSFDLVAAGPNQSYITACDMCHVPLKNNTVDIGVFCLSLMGTNIVDFITEAYRVMKVDGILYIAEVRSRFVDDSNKKSNKKSKNANSKNSASTNPIATASSSSSSSSLQQFKLVLEQCGFRCLRMDQSNTLFMMLVLQKSNMEGSASEISSSSINNTKNTILSFTAKPCIYKRR